MQELKSKVSTFKIWVVLLGLFMAIGFSVLGEYTAINNQFLRMLITVLSIIPYFVFLAFASLTDNYMGSLITGAILLGLSLLGHVFFYVFADWAFKPWIFIVYNVSIVFIAFPVGYMIGSPYNEKYGRNEKLNRIKNKRSLKFGV